MKYDINCSLIILYTKDKVLLQKRTVDAPVLANYWGFFGGGIEENETPKDTVIRETYEELHYKLDKFNFFLEKSFALEGKSGYMYVYIEKFNGNINKLVCYEGERLGWFKSEDIENLKLLPHDKDIIYKLFEYIKKG